MKAQVVAASDFLVNLAPYIKPCQENEKVDQVVKRCKNELVIKNVYSFTYPFAFHLKVV